MVFVLCFLYMILGLFQIQFWALEFVRLLMCVYSVLSFCKQQTDVRLYVSSFHLDLFAIANQQMIFVICMILYALLLGDAALVPDNYHHCRRHRFCPLRWWHLQQRKAYKNKGCDDDECDRARKKNLERLVRWFKWDRGAI